MKKFKMYSVIGSMSVLMASCVAINSGGQDDSFGWQNYPKSEQRDVDYSSTYADNNLSNSTELLDERPVYISDYSTYSTAPQPEVRYIPVVVPWWSPYSYSYSYYEPIYYTPGFYISMSFGSYYYPHYDYYRPNRYWHSDWYYWHHQRMAHPYSYGYYWDDNYGYNSGGYHNHNNNNGSKPTNSAGFGGRIFGANRGWSESNTVKPKTPISTTPRSETRGGGSSSGNTPTPAPNNGQGNRSMFSNPASQNNGGVKNSDVIKNSTPTKPIKDTPAPNNGQGSRNIFSNSAPQNNGGVKNSDVIKNSTPTKPIKDTPAPNNGQGSRNVFSNPAPVRDREVKSSTPERSTNTDRTPSVQPRSTAPVSRPTETPKREERPREVSKPAPSSSSSNSNSKSPAPKSTTERSNTRGGR